MYVQCAGPVLGSTPLNSDPLQPLASAFIHIQALQGSIPRRSIQSQMQVRVHGAKDIQLLMSAPPLMNRSHDVPRHKEPSRKSLLEPLCCHRQNERERRMVCRYNPKQRRDHRRLEQYGDAQLVISLGRSQTRILQLTRRFKRSCVSCGAGAELDVDRDWERGSRSLCGQQTS